MSHTPAPRRQIETRASNRTAHPGYADKAKTRRTTVEVQKERTTKIQAKAAREEARQKSINRTAEFELADMAEEGVADATPRPPFTPKQSRNQTLSDLTPLGALAAMNDIETSDDVDGSSFTQPQDRTVTSDESDHSTIESSVPTPRPKKKGRKAAAKTMSGKKGKKNLVNDSEVVPPFFSLVISANVEQLQVPKETKGKKTIRDKIAIATEKIKEKELSTEQDEESTGRRSSKARSQLQLETVESNRKPLKRQGAMVEEQTQSKRARQNKDDVT
jgi:hypothetical protein